MVRPPSPVVLLSSMLTVAAAGACAGSEPAGDVDAARIDAAAVDAREIDAQEADAAPIEPGLAAWWRFEELEGATIVDATGHGHDCG